MVLLKDISVSEAILKMADGYNVSLSVMLKLVQAALANDPDDHRGPLGPILSLDEVSIYGERIYRLFHSCNDDILDTLTLLRANNLGLVDRVDLLNASAGVFKEFQFDVIRNDVKSIAPSFCAKINCAKQGILYEREH